MHILQSYTPPEFFFIPVKNQALDACMAAARRYQNRSRARHRFASRQPQAKGSKGSLHQGGWQENRNCIWIPSRPKPLWLEAETISPSIFVEPSSQVPKPLLSDLLPHLSSLNAGPLKSHQLQGCPHSVQRPCGDLVDRIARLQLHLGRKGKWQVTRIRSLDRLVGGSSVHPLPACRGVVMTSSTSKPVAGPLPHVYSWPFTDLAFKANLAHQPATWPNEFQSMNVKWLNHFETSWCCFLTASVTVFEIHGSPRCGMGHNFAPGGLHGFVSVKASFRTSCTLTWKSLTVSPQRNEENIQNSWLPHAPFFFSLVESPYSKWKSPINGGVNWKTN